MITIKEHYNTKCPYCKQKNYVPKKLLEWANYYCNYCKQKIPTKKILESETIKLTEKNYDNKGL